MNYYIEASTGIKQLRPAPGETTRISGDYHLPPRVITALCAHALINEPLSPYERGYRFFKDILNVNRFLTEKGPDQAVSQQLVVGDFGYFVPEHPLYKNGVVEAMTAIGNVVQHNDLDGKTMTLIPGNHSPLESIPGPVRDQLINRGILVPSGHAQLTTPGVTLLDVKHGHEGDGRGTEIFMGNNYWVQMIYRRFHYLFRKLTGTSYFPYATPLTDVQALIINAKQRIKAEHSLPEGAWAVNSHTHFAQIAPPNTNSGEPMNLVSLENLQSMVHGHKFAQVLLGLAARFAPGLSGIDRDFLSNNHLTGYINTGQYDPLSQVLSFVDITDDTATLNLARVNGDYTENMLNQREHPAMWPKTTVDLREV